MPVRGQEALQESAFRFLGNLRDFKVALIYVLFDAATDQVQ